ncbi:MAG TPA: lipopolysaccharide biosynthesis protein, partial [Bradyrhizobium sp.]|uniref:lipopolysaccharide biosynthesis protein n=1 Tax=Bradyrhizobium sp. TaxID=376 RepID=UPI002D7F1453
MMIGLASINLTANALSAALGLLGVFVFTRLFAPHEYGVYLLGVGFASVVSTFLAGWFRNLILSEHARDDGADIRGLVLRGYLLCCLTAPGAYGLGRLVGLEAVPTAAAVSLAIAIGLFELTQDLARARLRALTALKGTLARAISALCLGVMVAFLAPEGAFLLSSAALASCVAVIVQWPATWGGISAKSDTSIRSVALQGLPLTLSLTLLAISSVTDRFMIANLIGSADTGRYIAGLDLVRQTLMMPAMSAAAAFIPMAVQVNASRGRDAVRSHLAECIELLFGVTLPACLGFAVISPHIANVVFGADFRQVAAQTMPILAVAVVFQILTQQYLHASFLLSRRNSFYLINIGAIIAANVVLSYAFVSEYGPLGAAWARLCADAFGFFVALALSRRAFPVPMPIGRLALVMIAGLVMASAVTIADTALHVTDFTACVILVMTGLTSYLALCWLLDICHARGRLRTGLAFSY